MAKRAYIVFFSFFVCCAFLCTRPLFAAEAKRVVVKNERAFIANLATTNTELDIQGNVDLNGKTYYLSKNCSITVSSGQIKNGSLVGQNTRLSVKKSASIGIKFLGTWESPVIDDSFFVPDQLSDDDVFNNINILQSRDIFNTIYLKKKQYDISIKENGGYALRLLDNCKLINKSIIRLRSNDLVSYSILYISGSSNIDILGGKIIGDVGRHTYIDGSSSEWGMGIKLEAAKSITISDVYISHCIGDGIYICGYPCDYIGNYSTASQNIVMRNVVTDANRRQGMSIIFVDNLLVENCSFVNTGTIEKTAPSAGIDIEPNIPGWNTSVRNITIKNCVFKGNQGRSFEADLSVSDGNIDNYENVVVEKCSADGQVFVGAPDVTVKDTKMESILIRPFEAPMEARFENCRIKGSGVFIEKPHNHKPYYIVKENTPQLLGATFVNCKFQYKAKSGSEQTDLIVMEKGVKVGTPIVFESCRISIPSRFRDIKLVSRDNGSIVHFNKCSIRQRMLN